MKHLKQFENEQVSDNEISKLFSELEYHYKKHQEIDNKLANICLEKIESYLKSDPEKAKKIYYDFYRDLKTGETNIFSFENDMILHKINQNLKLKNDTDKYNV